MVVSDPLEQSIVELLSRKGALRFDMLHRELGGFRNDVFDALWRLAWAGVVTNDTLAPVRSLTRQGAAKASGRRGKRGGFRSRRSERVPGSEGRWALFMPQAPATTPTERQTAIALQLVSRYGVVTRELVAAEGLAGGFAGLYPIFKAFEETGRVRRGYFIAGQGGAQFAMPGAEDRLRERPAADESQPTYVLAATDPANPYGAALPWPATAHDIARPHRVAAARVFLRDGELIGYLSRSGKNLISFLPSDEPPRTRVIQALVTALVDLAGPRTPVYLQKIDGRPAPLATELVTALAAAGFITLRDAVVHRGGPRARAMTKA